MNLQESMEWVGISVEQLAADLGVSPRAVGRWLNGSRPNDDNVRKVNDYFNWVVFSWRPEQLKLPLGSVSASRSEQKESGVLPVQDTDDTGTSPGTSLTQQATAQVDGVLERIEENTRMVIRAITILGIQEAKRRLFKID